MKRFLPFLLILFLLSGCAVPAAAPESGVTFTDALGRTVTVSSPQRVGALLGSFADVWVLSGGTLCAAADDAWEDFALDSEFAVNIGGAHSPSLELLLSADPDFVIASASTASHVAMRETLEAAGITVAYFDVDNFEDYLGMLDICTDITGRKDLYERSGLHLQQQIEEVKRAAEELPQEQRRVLLIRAAASVIKAKGSTGTILGEMLADLGCINIADSDSGLLETLSVEAVIRQQPHHIFVVTMGSNTEGARAALEDMILQNPAWSTLDAVQNGRLHFMEKNLFNLKPNARWAQAYRILYEALANDKT